MQTNNYFLKTTLILLSACIISPQIAHAMQQLKTYEHIKKNKRRTRCCMSLAGLAIIISGIIDIRSYYANQDQERILHQNVDNIMRQKRNCCAIRPQSACDDEFNPQRNRAVKEYSDFYKDMPPSSSYGLFSNMRASSVIIGLSAAVMAAHQAREENDALNALCAHVQQDEKSIAELNQEQRKIVFEKAVKHNNCPLMKLMLPHIKNAYVFLDSMLTIAIKYKHENAMKFLAHEIRKHITPQKIDRDIYDLGTHLPKGIPELITDYIAYAEPAAPQAANEDLEQD
jgi:hypothetical protein